MSTTERKKISRELQKKYKEINTLYTKVEKMENSMEFKAQINKRIIEEKLKKEKSKLKEKERIFEKFILDNGITEVEWSEWGLEDFTCCTLEEYMGEYFWKEDEYISEKLKAFYKWHKEAESNLKMVGDLSDVNCLIFEFSEEEYYTIGIRNFGEYNRFEGIYYISQQNEEELWLLESSNDDKDLLKWLEIINKRDKFEMGLNNTDFKNMYKVY